MRGVGIPKRCRLCGALKSQTLCSVFPQNDTDTEWPRITIVTPSYNQAKFLPKTIDSVLAQQYPNLEYIVLDGGSQDESRKIIEHYAGDLTYWRSHPDGGQAAAIAEGFSMATGEILGWVNSDDLLAPGALKRVAAYFVDHPDSLCLCGGTVVVDENDHVVRDRYGLPRIVRGEKETLKTLLLRKGCSFYQPASFWRKSAYLEVGGVDASIAFAMDFDLYLRFAELGPIDHLDTTLAFFRTHSESKSSRMQTVKERDVATLCSRYEWVAFSSAERLFAPLVLHGRNILVNLPKRVHALICGAC